MRFCSLGSGSRGNATLIEAGNTRLLVDCGYSVKELERRLQLVGMDPSRIDALLITHEHDDHIRGANAFARRYGIPLWATQGTLRKQAGRRAWHTDVELQPIGSGVTEIQVGEILISPYTVPHDSAEPCQFLFEASHRRFAMLTDAGSITPHIVSTLSSLDALFLECNHDLGMLHNGPYPPSLQARVAGDHGHLNNRQAAKLLESIHVDELQCLVAGHISEKNNHPDLVERELRQAVPDLGERLTLLQQDSVSDWFEIN